MASSSPITMTPKPYLQHVATAHFDLAPPVELGAHSAIKSGSFQRYIAMPSGTITFTPTYNSVILSVLPATSSDFITVHPAQKIVTLDLNILAQAQSPSSTAGPDSESKVPSASGALFRFRDRGTISLDALTSKILLGHPEARSTEFGESEILETIRCTTASEEFDWMNWATLVGQGRLVVGEVARLKKLVAIEFRIFRFLSTEKSMM